MRLKRSVLLMNGRTEFERRCLASLLYCIPDMSADRREVRLGIETGLQAPLTNSDQCVVRMVVSIRLANEQGQTDVVFSVLGFIGMLRGVCVF